MKNILTVLTLTLSTMAWSQDALVLTKDNSVSMNKIFSPESVANITQQVRELDSRTESKDPIILVLNSPGGSIDPGLELIENLSNLKRPVTTLNIFSASMGFHTTQGLGERLITQNGTLMSHKARGAFSGEFPGQLDSRYNYYLKRIARLDEQATRRTKGKYSVESYRALIENEYWCDGYDCVVQGFADRVVRPSCDKSLDGSHTETVDQFMFMGIAVQINAEYDNCPLNTNALKYEVSMNGKKLFNDPSSPSNVAFWTLWQVPASVEDRPKINAEILFEIQKRVGDVVSKRLNKEVVKGY